MPPTHPPPNVRNATPPQIELTPEIPRSGRKESDILSSASEFRKDIHFQLLFFQRELCLCL